MATFPVRRRAVGAALGLAVAAAACAGTPTPAAPTPEPPTPQAVLDAGPVEVLWSRTGAPDPLKSPSGLALDGQGRLFVVDTENDRLRVFSTEGEALATWGEPGSGPGQFQFVSAKPTYRILAGVAVDRAGNVYVADAGNARIQVFDREGTFLRQWGEPGTAEGQFVHPVDVAVDDEGNVYVLDDQAVFKVHKFDAQGELLLRWGETGEPASQILGPITVALDRQSHVLVADYGTFAAFQFDREGGLLQRWAGLPRAPDGTIFGSAGIAADSRGRVHLTDYINHRAIVMDPQGQVLLEWGNRSLFMGPADIVIDENDDLYVSGFLSHQVLKLRLTE